MNEKLDKISSPNFRIFGSEPVIKSGKGKIVAKSKDMNKLLENVIKVLDQVPDVELKKVLEADIRHQFKLWYGKRHQNLEAKDFVINEDAKISSNVKIDKVN